VPPAWRDDRGRLGVSNSGAHGITPPVPGS
jgi:hypothetical protein